MNITKSSALIASSVLMLSSAAALSLSYTMRAEVPGLVPPKPALTGRWVLDASTPAPFNYPPEDTQEAARIAAISYGEDGSSYAFLGFAASASAIFDGSGVPSMPCSVGSRSTFGIYFFYFRWFVVSYPADCVQIP